MSNFITGEKLAAFETADQGHYILYGSIDNARKIYAALSTRDTENGFTSYLEHINYTHLEQIGIKDDRELLWHFKEIGGEFRNNINAKNPNIPKNKARLYWSMTYHLLNENDETPKKWRKDH